MSERYGDCKRCGGKAKLHEPIGEPELKQVPGAPVDGFETTIVTTVVRLKIVPCSRCNETGHEGDAFESRG